VWRHTARHTHSRFCWSFYEKKCTTRISEFRKSSSL
jgi:hypothetical protein